MLFNTQVHLNFLIDKYLQINVILIWSVLYMVSLDIKLYTKKRYKKTIINA